MKKYAEGGKLGDSKPEKPSKVLKTQPDRQMMPPASTPGNFDIKKYQEGRVPKGGGYKKGGKTKKYAKGGKVSSASKRADGCVTKGKTRGRMV
jgi:hypothetical protein